MAMIWQDVLEEFFVCSNALLNERLQVARAETTLRTQSAEGVDSLLIGCRGDAPPTLDAYGSLTTTDGKSLEGFGPRAGSTWYSDSVCTMSAHTC